MDSLAALGRMSVSLVAVLGLLWLISRWLRRSKVGKVAAAGEITVLTRTAVGHKAGVAVVKVGDRALVVGVTEAAVSLLSDMPLSAVTADAQPREDREVLQLPADLTGGVQAVQHPRQTVAVPQTRAERRAVESAAQAPADAEGVTTHDSAGATPDGAVAQSVLAGSAISPQTWIKAVDVLRERTTRR